VRHNVRKLVAASSASVYGEPSHLPINEDHPFNNRTLYGAAKVATEQLLRSYNEMHRLRYVALRYFNLYGPRMDMTGVYTEVMIRWLDSIEAGRAPVIFGTGYQTMDFVYIGDCVRANMLALRSGADDDVFNVATGVETSLNDLCRILLEKTGRTDLEAEYRSERKVNPVQRRQGGVGKAARVLGFRSEVDIEDGLSKLISWRCEQRGTRPACKSAVRAPSREAVSIAKCGREPAAGVGAA
jgi:UDP-glucose 4-epimerase